MDARGFSLWADNHLSARAIWYPSLTVIMNEEPIDTIKSYINTACEMPEAEGWEDITTEMVEWSDSMSKIRVSISVE